MFKIDSNYKPTKDQENAINSLSKGYLSSKKDQILLGVTGSGKTFTIANVIAKIQKPTLVLAHNKTLAGQLYQEMAEFFPSCAVSYFVSYYDYYQPEAYIPSTDTYIEKEATINEFIDKLRLQTTSNILSHSDVIVVSSVSCIYNIGSASQFEHFSIPLKVGEKLSRATLMQKLVSLRYERAEFDFKRGTFRVRGNTLDIYPASEDYGVRVRIEDDLIERITIIDVLTGKITKEVTEIFIYSTKHYLVEEKDFVSARAAIQEDLEKEVMALRKRGKNFEAERLNKRVTFDLEMMQEVGYVNGIENYSRYFDGRAIGEAPNSLLDYFHYRFGNEWLMVIDESHMTIPQLNGMYNGDQARKEVLVDNGFRLKSAFDNRPLKFSEFLIKKPSTIYVSATPGKWELSHKDSPIVEQLVRPTGIVDPNIEIKPSESEVIDVVSEIEKTVKQGGRVLVSTITKRIAEDLTLYLKEKNIRAEYLHADVKTLERSSILKKLRLHEFDVLVGINLLREGLDLPEVQLVAILDADKEGFLRNKTSLIQTMGRAARNIQGRVILYANRETDSIKEAVLEVKRRRQYQLGYNKKHHLTPQNIIKGVRDGLVDEASQDMDLLSSEQTLPEFDSLTPYDKKKLEKKLNAEMKLAAKQLQFERAILLRDKLDELKNYL